MPANASAKAEHHAQRSLWARLVQAVTVESDPERLVPVAEVPRSAVPMVEDSLADAELRAIVRQIGAGNGRYAALNGRDDRFEVLVAARDARVASEVVAGF